MNRRNKEFAEEVKNLLDEILQLALEKAKAENLSSLYDSELDRAFVLRTHMSQRMLATLMCAQRHLDNLLFKKVVLVVDSKNDRTINGSLKLNPDFADKDVDLLITVVRMPKLNGLP